MCRKAKFVLTIFIYHMTSRESGSNITSYNTASNFCLLLQKEKNVKGGEGLSGKQAVGIKNGTR